jgi:hypothetical protein
MLDNISTTPAALDIGDNLLQLTHGGVFVGAHPLATQVPPLTGGGQLHEFPNAQVTHIVISVKSPPLN